jgi:hypothetical protein
VEAIMSEPETKRDSSVLALGGAAFLALAAFFLWRDLELPRELVVLAAVVIAGTATVLGRPRRWPVLAPAALLAATAAAGLWFLGDKRPALLPALAAALVAAVAAVLRTEGRAELPRPAPVDPLHRHPLTSEALAARLRWYGLGAALLAATSAFYFHFLTSGVAADSVVRRLVPTVFWLALGLALFIAGERRSRDAAHVGLALVAVALGKAVAYDTTHLAGGPRVAVLALVGGLLLFAAQIARRPAALPPAGRE